MRCYLPKNLDQKVITSNGPHRMSSRASDCRVSSCVRLDTNVSSTIQHKWRHHRLQSRGERVEKDSVSRHRMLKRSTLGVCLSSALNTSPTFGRGAVAGRALVVHILNEPRKFSVVVNTPLRRRRQIKRKRIFAKGQLHGVCSAPHRTALSAPKLQRRTRRTSADHMSPTPSRGPCNVSRCPGKGLLRQRARGLQGFRPAKPGCTNLLPVPKLHQTVLGFDIAVSHSFAMHVAETACNIKEQPEHLSRNSNQSSPSAQSINLGSATFLCFCISLARDVSKSCITSTTPPLGSRA
jgi:hypothetical protein